MSREVPEVETIHLGTDPSRFIEFLERGRWFEADAYSNENLRRQDLYATRRADLEAAATHVDMAG